MRLDYRIKILFIPQNIFIYYRFINFQLFKNHFYGSFWLAYFDRIKALFGSSEEFNLEQRLFIATTLFGFCIGILGFTVDLALNLGLVLVITPLIFSVICLLVYYLTRYKKRFNYIKWPFIIICYMVATIVWSFNGGWDSANVYLFLNAFVIFTIITSGKERVALLITFVILLSSLYIINYLYPELVHPYISTEERFSDIFPTMLYNVLILYSIGNFVTNNYYFERQRVEKKRKNLEEVNYELKKKKYELEILTNSLLDKNKIISSQNTELELLIRELTEKKNEIEEQQQELMTLNTELSEANAAKDKFFSILSHDLKNPLHGLLQTSEMLTLYYSKMGSDDLDRNLGNLYKITKSLNSLLENLLEWSRTTSGDLVITSEIFDLSLLVIDSINLSMLNAESKNIGIKNEITSKTLVEADRNSISTVLRNLLSNAVKFTHPGGTVTVNVYEYYNLNESGAKYFRVSVTDTGVGIDEDKIRNLFRIDESFSTRGTADEKGTGLGLVLCSELIRKNGGKIWVESTQGAGSAFHFTLPAGKDNN